MTNIKTVQQQIADYMVHGEAGKLADAVFSLTEVVNNLIHRVEQFEPEHLTIEDMNEQLAKEQEQEDATQES